MYKYCYLLFNSILIQFTNKNFASNHILFQLYVLHQYSKKSLQLFSRSYHP